MNKNPKYHGSYKGEIYSDVREHCVEGFDVIMVIREISLEVMMS